MTAPFVAGMRLTADAMNSAIPRRINTVTATTAAGPTSTTQELQVDSITVSGLIIGRRYRVRHYAHWNFSVATDEARARMRLTDAVGAELQILRFGHIGGTAASSTEPIEFEFIAGVTSGTFVITVQRASGTGTITRHATATQPIYLTVDAV